MIISQAIKRSMRLIIYYRATFEIHLPLLLAGTQKLNKLNISMCKQSNFNRQIMELTFVYLHKRISPLLYRQMAIPILCSKIIDWFKFEYSNIQIKFEYIIHHAPNIVYANRNFMFRRDCIETSKSRKDELEVCCFRQNMLSLSERRGSTDIAFIYKYKSR